MQVPFFFERGFCQARSKIAATPWPLPTPEAPESNVWELADRLAGWKLPADTLEADKLVAKGEEKLTREKAIDKVMKARPDLVTRYKAEQTGAAS